MSIHNKWNQDFSFKDSYMYLLRSLKPVRRTSFIYITDPRYQKPVFYSMVVQVHVLKAVTVENRKQGTTQQAAVAHH